VEEGIRGECPFFVFAGAAVVGHCSLSGRSDPAIDISGSICIGGIVEGTWATKVIRRGTGPVGD